jgi:hypothetical protein
MNYTQVSHLTNTRRHSGNPALPEHPESLFELLLILESHQNVPLPRWRFSEAGQNDGLSALFY